MNVNWSAVGWNVLSAVISAALGAFVHQLSGGDATATVATMGAVGAAAHALPSPWKK